jgi:hypothetical protein
MIRTQNELFSVSLGIKHTGRLWGGITPPLILLYFICIITSFLFSFISRVRVHIHEILLQQQVTCNIYIYDSVVHFPSQHISWDLNTIRSYTGECSVLIAKTISKVLFSWWGYVHINKWRSCWWSNGATLPYSTTHLTPICILRSRNHKITWILTRTSWRKKKRDD